MTLTIDTAVRNITVEEVVPHAAETVWKVLSTPELIQRWLMRNDFKPGLGQHFVFHDRPRGDWNGVVDCEITVWDPPRQLAYTWVGGSATNAGDGAALDSLVTWTLTEVPGGTRVRMVHDGFRSPRNDFAFEGMSPGWAKVLPRISQLAADLART
jgi:uncharacterized protein YndB with AHSA1/START domain